MFKSTKPIEAWWSWGTSGKARTLIGKESENAASELFYFASIFFSIISSRSFFSSVSSLRFSFALFSFHSSFFSLFIVFLFSSISSFLFLRLCFFAFR